MTTSQQQLTNDLSKDVLSTFWTSYFRENFRALVQDQLLETFEALKRNGFTKAALARKLNKRPEQVTRWLAAPSNLEIDTISDIALAMGCVPKFTLEKVLDRTASQNHHPLTARLDSWKADGRDDYIKVASGSSVLTLEAV